MPDRLRDLRESGVGVWLCRGVSNSLGTQHSKTLLVDDYLILGSTNWTNASRNNQEISVLIRVSEAGRDAWDERLGYMTLQVTEFTEEDYIRARNTRTMRPRSAGPEKYATAKRFSIARQRSLQLAEAAALKEASTQGSEPRHAPAALAGASASAGRTWIVGDKTTIARV